MMSNKRSNEQVGCRVAAQQGLLRRRFPGGAAGAVSRGLWTLALVSLALAVPKSDARFEWANMFVPEEERNELAARINAHFRAIRENGCPVSLEELNAFYSYPGDPDKNAAPVYERAFAKINSPREEVSHLPVIGEAELPGPGERLNEDQLEAIAAFLDRNAQALELAGQAAALDSARFDIDLREGWELLIPHVGQMSQLARVLHLRAVYAAETGDVEGVVLSIQTMESVARAIAQEPMLVSYLTSRAIAGMQAEAILYALSRIEFSSRHLLQLEASLENSRSPDGLGRALCGERAFRIATFRTLVTASSSSELLEIAGMGGDVLDRLKALTFNTYLRVSGFWLKDFLFYLDSFRDAIAVAQLPLEERTRSPQWENLQDLGKVLSEQPFFFSAILAVSAEGLFRSDLISHTRTHAVQLALGAERRRAETGEYPENLQELLAEVYVHRAINLYNSEPFEYEVTDHGFRIGVRSERIESLVVRRAAD